MRLLEQHTQAPSTVRVRFGGFTAQCPRCEAAEFHEAADILSCLACGTQTSQAELLQQIARNARLVADVLAERARRFESPAN